MHPLTNIKELVIDTHKETEKQLKILLKSVFFYTKKQIISFPGQLYFKLPEEEAEDSLDSTLIPACFEDYDIKLNSYETDFTDDKRIILKYYGKAEYIVLEPSYKKLNNIRNIFLHGDRSGTELFKTWKQYYVYRGELKPNEDRNIIIWEDTDYKFYFNSYLVPIERR
jgi:hypothetical protein